MPSPAMFAKVWAECKGKRTVLMKKFGIGWTKLQSWIAQEPMFADIMAECDLEFLEHRRKSDYPDKLPSVCLRN